MSCYYNDNRRFIVNTIFILVWLSIRIHIVQNFGEKVDTVSRLSIIWLWETCCFDLSNRSLRECARLYGRTIKCMGNRSKRSDAMGWVISSSHTVVAVQDEQIVVFGDIDDSGYLDRLFVHKDHQGEGVTTAICDELNSQSQKNESRPVLW